MNCPACGATMTEVTVANVKVDACEAGCGGLWFDRFELAKVERAGQSAGARLQEIQRSAPVRATDATPRQCPRDPGVVLARHYSSVKRTTLVDECAKCGGVFLDAGELSAIEAEYPTEAERHKATEAYYGQLFDEQLATVRSQDKAAADRARRVAHLLRFVCPSYYIPGKQKWGAF
jgi:uncharacterized protein